MIKKVNKVEPLKKESTYEEREKARHKKRLDDANALKQKEIDRLAEEKRIRTLVKSNVEVVQKHLRGKKLTSFWVFPDISGFKKINGLNFDGMQNKLKENVDKYKNKKIVYFSIPTYLKTITKQKGETLYWITVNMIIYPIDKHSNMLPDKAQSCVFGWDENDFKITKFSFKFLEHVMNNVIKTKYFTSSIYGIGLDHLIEDLEKKGIKFDDVLSPLANA